MALSAEGLPRRVPRDLLSSSVPIGDVQIRVDGEHAVGHVVQDDIHHGSGGHGSEVPREVLHCSTDVAMQRNTRLAPFKIEGCLWIAAYGNLWVRCVADGVAWCRAGAPGP